MMTLYREPSQISIRSDDEHYSVLNDWMRIFGKRQLREATAELWLAILRTFTEVGTPQSVRQIFYQLVVKRILPKREQSYSTTVYHLKTMRRRYVIPYHWIADNTRLIRKPHSHDSLSNCLQTAKETYRRSLWANQQVYIEVWCEKDALTGVIYEVTKQYDVPLMVTRGFSSLSFVHSAAVHMKSIEKECIINYLSDHDPSGVAAYVDVRNKFHDFGVDVSFIQLAVLPRQVEEWNLPTRPTNKTDSRAAGWEGASVELDAIPANVLRDLVRSSIEQHIDQRALDETIRIEAMERETLGNMMAQLNLGTD